MADRSLGLVIPTYNEATILPRLFARLKRLQEEVPRLSEIIFVDDGSSDESFHLLLEAASEHCGWRVLRLSRNFGQQIATMAGLRHTSADGVILMDADLQDPPEAIPKMVELWDQGWDVVYGIRRVRHGESWLKRASAKLFYRLLRRLSDVDIPIDAGDFRLLDRRVVSVLNRIEERRPYLRGLSAWVGFRQTGLVFERQPRVDGQSNYSLGKMVHLSVDAITGFSSTPLKLVTRIGLLVACSSGIYGIVVLARWLNGSMISGWAMMMIAMLFLGSVQLISLGIIGEYLANLSIEARKRPLFVVEFDSKSAEQASPSVNPHAIAATGEREGESR